MFENRVVLDEIARKIAFVIDVNLKVKFCELSENAIYIAYNKKPLYIIRISRTDYRTKSELNTELCWLNIISYLPVPKPVGGVREIDGYFGVVFNYIEGKEPEYNDENIMKECGRLSALLHISKKPENPIRPVWSPKNMVGENAYWGNWRDNKNLTNEEKDFIESILNKAISKIKNYKSKKYGLIHFDLRMTNLIVGDKFYAIDFDDSGFGYYIQDLASALSFMEDSPKLEKLKDAWYKGYKEISNLDDEDYEISNSFIILRRIQLLAWITSHSESFYVKSIRKDFEKNTILFLKNIKL
ncbi:MAG: phosphotransferase enzyme family protein [Lachnospirales bacterium]